jgi:hypothetical protein
MDRDPILSPSGRFRIDFCSRELGNTLWVETPTLVDTKVGDKLIDFKDQHWSLDIAQWKSDSVVMLELRKFPGNHEPNSLFVTVDCMAGTAAVGDSPPVALAVMERALDRALTWIYAKPAPSPAPHPVITFLKKWLPGE